MNTKTLIRLAVLLSAVNGFAADTITIGSVSGAPGQVVQVPVYVRDADGTVLDVDGADRIQGIAFKVAYSPSDAVTAASFARAGVTQPLTPLYQQTVSSAGAIAWIGSFAASSDPIPFTLNGAPPGNQVGTLSFTTSASASGTITLTIDVATAMLSNQAGTVGETVANAQLTLVNGAIEVGGAATTTTVSSNPNPSSVNQDVTFTANVTSATPGTITGTVSFRAEGVEFGSATLAGGVAQFTTNDLAEGSHSVTAVYEGEGAYASSTSSPMTQVVNLAPFGAPQGVNAIATGTSTAQVTWLPVATADYYEVWRRTVHNGTPVLAGSPGGATFNDGSLGAGVTYLYSVKAVRAGDPPSAESAFDWATTIIFDDDPIANGTTAVEFSHLDQARNAVNAFRAAANLGPFAFSGGAPAVGSVIRAANVIDLRTALNQALGNLGRGPLSVTDDTITPGVTVIKGAHVQEIRNAVK